MLPVRDHLRPQGANISLSHIVGIRSLFNARARLNSEVYTVYIFYTLLQGESEKIAGF